MTKKKRAEEIQIQKVKKEIPLIRDENYTQKINETKTKIDIEDAFENATDGEIKKIEELIDTAMENMSYEMGYFEEKYYKTGFADGVRLIIECVGR